MNYIIINAFIFLCGIIGSLLGCLLSFFISPNNKRFLSVSIAFTSGLMLGMICFGLIPEAIYSCGDFITISIIILITLVILFIELNVEKIKSFNIKNASGFIILFGIALHNLPEGIAVGSSFVNDRYLGLLIAITIILHDIPEGFVLAVPFNINMTRKRDTIIYSILAGIPTGIGCIIGTFFGSINNISMGICMAMAAAAMLYIIISDLIPEYNRINKGKLPIIANIIGIILGILLMEWK
ncbi:ZIP family metal transporter [Caldicellulosiruptoraceae bacterium PP1]